MRLLEVLKGWIGPVTKPAGVPDVAQTPAQPVDPARPPSIIPARRMGPIGGPSTTIPGGAVFSDQDPYLSGGEPLIPKDGSDAPRRFQYPPGYNIQITPRSTEPISFAQLRALGDSTLVRIIIEHLKNSIKAHEWDITTIDDHETALYGPEMAQIINFLQYPDKEHAWDEWVGMICEESLVIDALTVYKHKTYGGQLDALEIIDGSTMKVLIDTRGFTPNPPTPAYQQFLYGVPKTWYTKDEMIYAPRNRRVNKFYGFSEVEQIIVKINEAVRREFSNLAQFSDGNTPAGIATLPKEWSLEQIKKFDVYFNELLSGNAQRRSKLFFGPEGMQVHKFHDDETFGLFSKYDEWLARVTCFTFGVSPMPFITLTNRAAAQEMGDVEAEGGVATMKMFIERLVNRVIAEDFHQPRLRFNWITDRSRMQEKRVKRNVSYAESAIFTPNEVRADEGKEPIEGGDILYFNGAPLGMAPVAAGTPTPPVDPAAAAEADAARPDMEDGSRPVVHAAHASALRKCMTDELGKWERYAIKRYEEGKPGDAILFEAEYLTNDDCLGVIRGLTKSRSKDQVKHLFDTRRAGVRAIRFEPHNSGAAAGYASDMKGVIRDILTSRLEGLAKAAPVYAEAPAREPASSIPDVVLKFPVTINTPQSAAPVVNVAAPAPIVIPAPVVHVEAAKSVVIPAPNVSVVNKVSPAEVHPADIVNRVEVLPSPPAPVEKVARPKRSYRIVRDQDGNMSGLEEK